MEILQNYDSGDDSLTSLSDDCVLLPPQLKQEKQAVRSRFNAEEIFFQNLFPGEEVFDDCLDEFSLPLQFAYNNKENFNRVCLGYKFLKSRHEIRQV